MFDFGWPKEEEVGASHGLYVVAGRAPKGKVSWQQTEFHSHSLCKLGAVNLSVNAKYCPASEGPCDQVCNHKFSAKLYLLIATSNPFILKAQYDRDHQSVSEVSARVMTE